MSRIAIVDFDKCRPSKCKQECRRFCPVNASGKQCVEIVSRSVAGTKPGPEKEISKIAENLCVGCGICVGKCPFQAITIVKTPSALPEIVHMYGPNTFRLCNLPMPRRATVLGLLGQNGLGKSLTLMIMAGKLIPNFGNGDGDKKQVIKHYRGTELQNFFNFLYGKSEPRVVVKPQYVESIRSVAKGPVKQWLTNLTKDSAKFQRIVELLDLDGIMEKNIDVLSGGELQRFAVAATVIQDADIYMFDEPSSFLDIRQRVNMAKCIREILLPKEKYIIVIEHDVSILDYLSDYICCLYGQPGVYGIVSPPFTCGEGINNYLDGYIPVDNVRFRTEPINYRMGALSAPITPLENMDMKSDLDISETIKGEIITPSDDIKEVIRDHITYPLLRKTYPCISITVDAGKIYSSEVICLVGPNGTGKTTFIKMLCGKTEPDNGIKVPVLNVSYKPQIIEPTYKGTVEQLLYNRIPDAMSDSQFKSDVLKPMDVEHIMGNSVITLSGGEIQRVAIILALGKPADIYLLDEPSCYLDIEQRLITAKVIKRFITNSHKYCFVVEHDFIMSTYLAERVIVFQGAISAPLTPLSIELDTQVKSNKTEKVSSIDSKASSPMDFVSGFNLFLKTLDITFRRSKFSMRPRINKQGSQHDREQKRAGNYFITDDSMEPIKSFIESSVSLEW